jgi:putative effector of murein hydrolase LrgA (UPF0299 family)
MFLYCNYGIASTNVCCGFWECLAYFLVDDLILLFVAFVELLELAYVFFSVYEIIWLFVLSYKTLMWNGHDRDEVKYPWCRWCEMSMMMMIYLCSAGTLTCIKSLETFVGALLPPYMNDSQYQIVSFLLVRTVRSSVHIIKLPNPIINMAILKIIILVKFWNRSRVSNRQRSNFSAIR